LLAQLGITEPEDIKIEAIAQYCGATVLYEPLDGCAARILGFGDRAIITVDQNSRRGRQRFSVGHELGHWILDRGRGSFECESKVYATEWSSDNPEKRANRYAAELLLPENMFRPRVKNREITFDTVKDMTKKFTTSLTATAIRLVELGSYPAIVICSENGRMRWFVPGPDVPSQLKPRDELSPGSVAYDILKGISTTNAPVDVYAEDWITPFSMLM
jgi:hypothetical protein